MIPKIFLAIALLQSQHNKRFAMSIVELDSVPVRSHWSWCRSGKSAVRVSTIYCCFPTVLPSHASASLRVCKRRFPVIGLSVNFIHRWLDYCNAVLTGTAGTRVKRAGVYAEYSRSFSVSSMTPRPHHSNPTGFRCGKGSISIPQSSFLRIYENNACRWKSLIGYDMHHL